MAKIIYEDNNGNQTVLREGNLYKGDVFFCADYFAMKLWGRDDVRDSIIALGYEATEENIDKVIGNGGNWGGLNDCTEGEWECIYDVILSTLKEEDKHNYEN